MDVLQSCAQNYAALCSHTYDCIIARKGNSIPLHFTFSPYEFRHLAGLHHLEHSRLKTNSERLFKEILAGRITLATLKQSANWNDEQDFILPRLSALSQLGTIMDEFSLIYGFSGAKLLRQPAAVRTRIDADYLIKFQLPDGITFFFSVQQKDSFCGRSIFINDALDYSAGQTRFTLLQKIRTDTQTGASVLLYQRETYHP